MCPRRNIVAHRRTGNLPSLDLAPPPHAGLSYTQSNAIMWHDPAVGITTSGSEITYLANQGSSGSAQDVQQTVSSKRPTYNASDANFNGNPTMSFDKSAFQLLEQVGTLPAAPTHAEVFLVAKGNSDPAASGAGAPFHLSNVNRPAQIPFTNGIIYVTFFQPSQLGTVNPSDSLASPFIYNESVETGMSLDANLHIHLNGSQIYALTNTNIAGGWQDPFWIGRGNHPSADRYWDGEIAELITFPHILSPTDKADVTDWLQTKHAL